MATMPTVNANVTVNWTFKGTKQRLTELLEDLHLQAREEGVVDADKLLDALDLAELLHEVTYTPLPWQPATTFPIWTDTSPNTCQACAHSGVCNCVNPPGSPIITC